MRRDSKATRESLRSTTNPACQTDPKHNMTHARNEEKKGETGQQQRIEGSVRCTRVPHPRSTCSLPRPQRPRTLHSRVTRSWCRGVQSHVQGGGARLMAVLAYQEHGGAKRDGSGSRWYLGMKTNGNRRKTLLFYFRILSPKSGPSQNSLDHKPKRVKRVYEDEREREY